MASGGDANAVAGLASEAVAPIEEELRRRLLAEVGEQDALAIETALLKAFINGMRAGGAEVAEASVETSGMFAPDPGQLTGGTGLGEPLPWLDPWADRYAGGE
jgi:hypothetical protein